MLKWFSVYLLLCILVWSCSQNEEGTIVHSTFTIKGMTCEMGCARSIEEALSEVPGVTDIKVDFNLQKAKMSFNAQLFDQNLLVQTVHNLAGGKYKIEDFKKIKPNSKPLGSTRGVEDMPVKDGAQVHIPPKIPFPNIFDFIELR